MRAPGTLTGTAVAKYLNDGAARKQVDISGNWDLKPETCNPL
jgi:hypothetical protein